MKLLAILLTVVFVTLKICNVINWPWYYVISPIFIYLWFIMIMGIIYFWSKLKEEELKDKERRGRKSKWQERMEEMQKRKEVKILIIALSLFAASCSKTIPFAGTARYPIIIKTCKEWQNKPRIGKFPGDSICTNYQLDTIYGKFKQP